MIFNPILRVFVCAVLTLQLTGCGTLMFPERKGQRDGKIDAGVAVLDGIGLLLFIIPGVIAFIVDFNNGTIYLPGTQHRVVKFDPKHSNMASIEKLIKEQTGQTIALDRPNVKVAKLRPTDDPRAELAKLDEKHSDELALF